MNRVLLALVCISFACDSAPEPESVKAAPAAATPAKDAAPKAEVAKAPGTDAIPADGGDDECLYGKHGGECMAPPEAGSNDGHFGAAFAVAESRTLASAIEGIDALSGPVKVTGQVGQVCQKKGCWMVIEDGDRQARVMMKDHAFAVPMDGKGSAAIVEGELSKRTFTAAQVRHIAKDAGTAVPTDAKDSEEYVLTASAVALTRS